MAISSKVELSGGVFERPQPILDYHVGVMTKELATQAEMAIQFQGTTSFRYEHSKPTGEWARSIKTRQARAISGQFRSGWTVHDSGIVYGPWLEGEGSRNSADGFPGYFTFRKVRDQIARKAPQKLLPETRRMARDLER